MKTVDVRLLVADDVDEQLLVSQLVTQTRGAGAPLGAARLLDDGSGLGLDDRCPARTRAGVDWDGRALDDR